MNRVFPALLDNQPAAGQAATPRPTRVAPLAETPLRLFHPVHYEPNYAYPLFVWLHGTDSDERQIAQLMPYVSVRNYVAVAPRGTIGVSSRLGRRRHRWPLPVDRVAAAHQRIVDSIRLARERFTIAPKRIFLAGADEGGTLALRIALRYPGQFAGVLSAGGLLPTDGAPLSRLNAARRLPVFLAWRQESEACVQGLVDDNLRLLHAAGLDVSLRLYDDGEQGSPIADPDEDAVTRLVLRDMDRWMMALVTGGGAPQPAR